METLKNTNIILTITDEFKNLIRPLSYSEYKQLEKDIKEFGCISPIIIWGSNNIILDGHNRYKICLENNIEFKTKKLDFSTENDAKYWMINNQLSRRNLSTYERCTLALKLDDIIKERAKQNQLSGLKQNIVSQKSDERLKKEPINTDKVLSHLAGVSHDTISKVRKIEALATDEQKVQLSNHKLTINRVYDEISKPIIVNLPHIDAPDKDEWEKYEIVIADFEKLFSLATDKIKSIVTRNPVFCLWCKPRNLEKAFKYLRRFNLPYQDCIIWNKNNERKSPDILLIAGLDKINYKFDNFKWIYTQNENEDKLRPRYFEDLINALFPNKRIALNETIIQECKVTSKENESEPQKVEAISHG